MGSTAWCLFFFRLWTWTFSERSVKIRRNNAGGGDDNVCVREGIWTVCARVRRQTDAARVRGPDLPDVNAGAVAGTTRTLSSSGKNYRTGRGPQGTFKIFTLWSPLFSSRGRVIYGRITLSFVYISFGGLGWRSIITLLVASVRSI